MNNQEFYELLAERANVRAYSGRVMFGKQCIGITLGQYSQNPIGLIAECVAIVEDEAERLELAKIFKNTKEDSMGKGCIIYWPDMAWDNETMQEYAEDYD